MQARRRFRAAHGLRRSRRRGRRRGESGATGSREGGGLVGGGGGVDEGGSRSRSRWCWRMGNDIDACDARTDATDRYRLLWSLVRVHGAVRAYKNAFTSTLLQCSVL